MTQLDNLCNWFSLSIFNNLYMCLKIRCNSMKSFVLKTKKGINVSLQALSLSLSGVLRSCIVPSSATVRWLCASSSAPAAGNSSAKPKSDLLPSRFLYLLGRPTSFGDWAWDISSPRVPTSLTIGGDPCWPRICITSISFSMPMYVVLRCLVLASTLMLIRLRFFCLKFLARFI